MHDMELIYLISIQRLEGFSMHRCQHIWYSLLKNDISCFKVYFTEYIVIAPYIIFALQVCFYSILLASGVTTYLLMRNSRRKDQKMLYCSKKMRISYWLHNTAQLSWWRHRMDTLPALLAICTGNSPATGEIPTQRPVTLSFDVFFDLRLNKQLSKQSWGWCSETPSYSLWRHCNDIAFIMAVMLGTSITVTTPFHHPGLDVECIAMNRRHSISLKHVPMWYRRRDVNVLWYLCRVYMCHFSIYFIWELWSTWPQNILASLLRRTP